MLMKIKRKRKKLKLLMMRMKIRLKRRRKKRQKKSHLRKQILNQNPLTIQKPKKNPNQMTLRQEKIPKKINK